MDQFKEQTAQTITAEKATMHKSAFVSALLLLSLFQTSCSNHNEVSDFAAIDASGWNYGDTLFLDLTSRDSICVGDLAVAIRHSADYDYSNIWLELSYPPADSLKADTVNITLADVYGNWYGTGLGLSYQYVDTVKKQMSMPKRIGIRHIMRVDRLKGIEQAGLIFKSSDE